MIGNGPTSKASKGGLEAYWNKGNRITIHQEEPVRGDDQYIGITRKEARRLRRWLKILLLEGSGSGEEE